MRLDGKYVITGSARGIGKETALNIQLNGGVPVIYGTNKELLNELPKEFANWIDNGHKILYLECDVSKADDVKNVMGTAYKNTEESTEFAPMPTLPICALSRK